MLDKRTPFFRNMLKVSASETGLRFPYAQIIVEPV